MADDDIDTSPIVSGEVAPAPSEFPKIVHVEDDEKSRDEIVREQFNLGLALQRAVRRVRKITSVRDKRKTVIWQVRT